MTSSSSMRSLTMPWGAALLLSALALVDAIFNYFWTGNGIHGTEGAALVIASTLLMLIAAALIGRHIARGWVSTVLVILLALDFVGTGLAAYLLQAWILLGLDILAAIAWLATFATPRTLTTAS